MWNERVGQRRELGKTGVDFWEKGEVGNASLHFSASMFENVWEACFSKNLVLGVDGAQMRLESSSWL